MKEYLAKVFIAAIKAEDGSMPEWYTFFPEGWIEIEGHGKALVDRQAHEQVAARFDRRGNDIVIDYEHQTLTGDKAPAAGWVNDFRYLDGVGIQGRVSWTDEAAGYIERDEYRYFSPVFLARKSDGRVVAVHSIALTNSPKINHLTPLLAKLGAAFREEDVSMEFLKKLAAKLGLGADADEAQVEAAVDEVIAKNTQLKTQAEKAPDKAEVVSKEILEVLDLKAEDGVSTVVASIHALKQATNTGVSREEFDRLQKDLRKRDATEIVAKAMKDGKVTPDQKEWAQEYAERDLEGFKVYVTKATVVIPVNDLPDKETEAGGAISDTVLNVAKLMGNTEDDLKQYGGVTA